MTDIVIILILISIWVLCFMSLLTLKVLGKLQPEEEPVMKITPMVTPTNPAFTNENTVGQGDSVIVESKSPQRIEWEEQEQLRKINLQPK